MKENIGFAELNTWRQILNTFSIAIDNSWGSDAWYFQNCSVHIEHEPLTNGLYFVRIYSDSYNRNGIAFSFVDKSEALEMMNYILCKVSLAHGLFGWLEFK